MKTIILLFISFFTSQLLFAQSEVYLNINHLLGENEAITNPNGTNNLGNDFTVTRMQYYLSKFILVHDNGQETPLIDIYALVDGTEETEIALGNLTFIEIEGIKFSVGVDADKNHLDPSTYSASHPLAPQNPSMHWGWTSGYRFVAMEGKAEPSKQTYEIHALGDALYFEANVVVSGVEENGNVYINIDGDYAEALRDINISSGLIEHSSSAEAEDLLLNFQTYVFKASPIDTTVIDTTTTAIKDVSSTGLVKVYPNPSNGQITFDLNNINKAESIEIYNMLGSLIQTKVIKSSNTSLAIEVTGFYLALIKDDLGTVIGRSKIIIE